MSETSVVSKPMRMHLYDLYIIFRYDVVNINEEPEDATEVFIIQEEANFEAQKVVVAPEEVTQVKEETVEEEEEEEEKPIIVYPEGTIQQYGDRPPAAAQPPIQQPPVRRPPPPNPRRPRPPPPNFRRPPPQYLPALSRNAPDQRPPPPPPQRGPPPPRGPIRRPPPPRPRPPPPPTGPPSNDQGIIGSISSWLTCKGTDAISGVKLQDEKFVRQQLDCVLDRGTCDELGTTLKRKDI